RARASASAPENPDGDVRAVALVAGLVLAAALSLFVVMYEQAAHPSALWAALWCVPFACCAYGIGPYRGRGSRLARWVIAGWLGATAAMPQLWAAHLDARLKAAER